MEYETEGAEESELSFFINRRIAYNDIGETCDRSVRGGVLELNGFESAFWD